MFWARAGNCIKDGSKTIKYSVPVGTEAEKEEGKERKKHEIPFRRSLTGRLKETNLRRKTLFYPCPKKIAD